MRKKAQIRRAQEKKSFHNLQAYQSKQTSPEKMERPCDPPDFSKNLVAK